MCEKPFRSNEISALAKSIDSHMLVILNGLDCGKYMLTNSLLCVLFLLNRGYFNDSGTCKECSGSCKTCEGSATKCQSCKSPLLLEQWECKPTCSQKHFAFDGICKHCPAMCLECIHSETCKGITKNCL